MDQSIAIQLRADIAQAVREMRNARREIGGVGRAGQESARNMVDLQRSLQEVERRMQGISRAGRTFRNVLAAIGIGVSIKGILDATIAQERAMANIEARIKSTGGAAGVTADQLAKMAGEFQNITTFGDEAILDAQSVLLSFTRIQGADMFREATQAVTDLAAAMNMDLRSAAQQVGRALNDPIAGLSALSRAGVQFTNEQRNTIRTLIQMGDLAGAQRVILDELATRYGGAARRLRDTFGGALTGLRNAFGDLLEAKSGLDDAKDSVEELTRLLQDPMVVDAINNITSALISGFGKAAQIVTGLNLVLFGPSDGLLRLDDEIRKIDGQLNKLESLLRRPRAMRLTTDPNLIGGWASDEAIQARIDALRMERSELADIYWLMISDRAERDREERQSASALTEIKLQETNDIKRALGQQVDAYREANRAFEQAQRERLQLEQRAADLRQEFAGASAEESAAANVVALYREFPELLRALESGDWDTAAKGAERLEERLRRAKEEGSLSSLEMKRLVGEVARVWEGIGAGREAEAAARLEAIQDKIRELTEQAAELSNLEISFDEAGAVENADALRELLQQQFALKPVQVPVVVQALESGGNRTPGYASGGFIRGPGSSRSDSILARLSNGEYVLPANAVRYYGLEYLERLRMMRLPKFANGGLVNNLRVPSVPSPVMGAGGGGTPVHIHLPSGDSFTLSGTNDQIDHVQRVLALASLKHGRR
ncbi:phage tail length tape measure family protein [Thioalkalivibrio sulfidiphilus]|uniref:phage tail length tape measure family protein n=1 Tax=Thioalkalivibrio sulfidiphilus TaxID=1033854 RepID=UPI000378C1B3|nr:phage tail length tape measure family protein [Thioalkalivibrio sulfidiphilus]